MKKVEIAGLIGWALVLAGLVACGGEDDPEARIRATLAAMEEAAEAGEPGNFLDGVAEDFGGQGGSYDRQRLGQLLRVQLLRHTAVQATILSQDYEMFPGRAKGTITVLLTGGPRNWLPESGRLYRVETGWVEREGEWLLLSADWDPVAGPP